MAYNGVPVVQLAAPIMNPAQARAAARLALAKAQYNTACRAVKAAERKVRKEDLSSLYHQRDVESARKAHAHLTAMRKGRLTTTPSRRLAPRKIDTAALRRAARRELAEAVRVRNAARSAMNRAAREVARLA